MKAEYKRDLQNNYLILEVENEQMEDQYGMVMAQRNEIPGLLKFHCSRKDGTLSLHYEITSKQTLESLYEKKMMGYQDILNILTDIRDIAENMQKYLLDSGQLLFCPQYVFVGPDRRIALCYFPKVQREQGIQALAEFILKRLNHEDTQAVMIGYHLYQSVCEDNFSLSRIWKELIGNAGDKENQERNLAGKGYSQEQYEGTEGKREKEEYGRPGSYGKREREEHDRLEGYGKRAKEEHDRSEGYEISEKDQYNGYGGMGGLQDLDEFQDTYEVIHKVRRKKEKKRKSDWLFERVHPAVMLSALALVAVIEILFYFGVIQITEAGGLFFLMLSIEMLINRFWKGRKNRKKEWPDQNTEDMREEYEKIQDELYQMESEEEELEETRCLVPMEEKEGIQLIHIPGGNEKGVFPDAYVEEGILYVGKRKGESDLILDSPTVSRMHARLEGRNGKFFVKDLNSRNGTYCNEERLHPQEEREIQVGDRISFAEVAYQVVKL